MRNNPTAIRTEAMRLAVASIQAPQNMVQVAKRAHYFAHFIGDTDRNTICDSIKCPYQIPLVPNEPTDAR